MNVRILLLSFLAAGCSLSHTPEDLVDAAASASLDAAGLDASPRARIDSGLTVSGKPMGALLFAEAEDASADVSAPTVTLDGPTTVLVVLDKSGSMGAGWSGEDTRWIAANKALVAALAPAQEQLTIGAVLFPRPDGCSVSEIEGEGQYPFVRGTEFLRTWKQTIERDGVSGSTPLERSFAVADAAIARAGELLAQRFLVIVLTDGEPTCDDHLEALESYPSAWLARGIRTHVMGLPGSEQAAALLDRVAKAGGTERHQQVGTPDQLESALAAVL